MSSDIPFHIDPARLDELMRDFKLPTDDYSRPALHLPLEGIVEPFSPEHRSMAGQTFVDVEAHPAYDRMNRLQQWGARTAETVLNLSQSFGYIDLATKRRMVDFGAGSGGPTLALAQLAEQNGGTVDAVESYGPAVQEMVDSGILPAERAHTANGIDFLHARGSSNEKADLITAFMLGPDSNGGLTGALLDAAPRALEPGGQLLVTSDGGTMATVRSVCDRRGVSYEYVYGVPGDEPLPDTLIASFPT